METCEVTKHSANVVGHQVVKDFFYIVTKNMISMSNPGTVVPPKMIHLLEILTSDFKNTIFKITSDLLGKGQQKSSVATILNVSKIYDASQISQMSIACNIENNDTNINSSSTCTSTSRN